jgi:hypothetical protein
MLARILLALFFGSCLWLEIRSQGAHRAPEIKPPVFAEFSAELKAADGSSYESSAPSDPEYGIRPQGGTLLKEAVHWVYLAYNEKNGSAKRTDPSSRP